MPRLRPPRYRPRSFPGLGRAVTTCAAPGARRAVRVCVTRPEAPGPAIRSADDACRVLRGAENADRESFWALHLDQRHRVIGVEEIARGQIDGVEVTPGDVFRGALASDAAKLLVVHNHPSGDPEPSADDFRLTERLVQAGKLLGVRVLDHVVVGAEGCRSLLNEQPALFSGAPVDSPCESSSSRLRFHEREPIP